MKNKMQDLRDHLFETMERVKSGDMDVSQARAMSEVGRTIIGTAKLELEYMERVDVRYDTGFIKHEPMPSNVRRISDKSA